MIMSGRKITILGGGNTAFAVAARLSHIGNEICILEHPEFAQSVEKISLVNQIVLEGVLESGPAPIFKITIDAKEGLSFSNLLLLSNCTCVCASSICTTMRTIFNR